ncbi:hypothetical protein Pan216_29960 [Planctomycetes bacterium Pan216]|uniref:Uncharacterized protein n=1 Tax=Kolteria novifilia TaxID=2527975 RepID=A0A518B579_9BACT|nr:hypothetical protein Pan216_29960 [Planctomycetes bacterium Pan216]
MTERIDVTCPDCGHSGRSLPGKRIRCPKCHHSFNAPNPAEEADGFFEEPDTPQSLKYLEHEFNKTFASSMGCGLSCLILFAISFGGLLALAAIAQFFSG